MALITVSLVTLRVTAETAAEDWPISVVSIIGTAFFAVLGALIVSRAGNPIGWLYLGVVAVFGLGLISSAYAELGVESGWPLVSVAAAGTDPFFFTGLALFVAFFFLFPTGHPASPRWRWAWRVYVVAVCLNFLGFLIQPTPNQLANEVEVPNPLGVESLGGFLDPFLSVLGMTILASAVAAFVSLVFRFRVGTTEVRQQIKWLVAVGALAGIALVGLIGTGIPLEGAEAAGESPEVLRIANNIFFFTLITSIVVGIPLVTALAILKYRLYDLDIVIRKTVVFAILAGFVTVIYVAIVVGLARLVGEDSLLLSVGATALVAALFQPVRTWATGFSNRVVFGHRAEPYQVLATFSGRMGETYADEDAMPRMARVIADGIGAERAEIWLGSESEPVLGAAWPAGNDAVAAQDRVVPVVYQEDRLGEIRVRKPAAEPINPIEEKLLEDLASQAGLVLRNVGLTVDLEARVAELGERSRELRASRMRIVQAHDAERRRLERNIHDGAQQHLVALAVKLRLAKAIAAKDPEAASAMLRTLARETEQARITLLDLASGIYPPVLEELGITEALRRQAGPAGGRLTVNSDGVGRLPVETEAAVYFVCLEAMQNAAKYAKASHVVVQLRLRNGNLTFEVRDDGGGFDTSAVEMGSGLSNMRDRLSAFGGDVEISSAPGRGTTVHGSLPLRTSVPA